MSLLAGFAAGFIGAVAGSVAYNEWLGWKHNRWRLGFLDWLWERIG